MLRSISIRLKLVGAVLLFLLAGGGLLLREVHRHTVALTGAAQLETAARVFDDLERQDVRRLESTLVALSHVDALRAAFVARDRGALFAAAAPVFEELKARFGVTHWYFHDLDGTCFLRVHARELHGDRIDRVTLRRAMQRREFAAGKELGQTAFALRVVAPFYAGDRLVGYVELGEEIDGFLRRMKELTRDDYALIVRREHLDAAAWATRRDEHADAWAVEGDALVVDRTAPFARLERGADARVLGARGAVLPTLEEGGRTLLRGLFPFRDAADRQVGALLVVHDTTAVRRGLVAGRTGATLAGVAILVLLLALLVAFLNRLVFARLVELTRKLEDAATRLVGGDYDAGRGLAPTADDEIGRFEAFFARFLVIVGGALRDASGRDREVG